MQEQLRLGQELRDTMDWPDARHNHFHHEVPEDESTAAASMLELGGPAKVGVCICVCGASIRSVLELAGGARSRSRKTTHIKPHPPPTHHPTLQRAFALRRELVVNMKVGEFCLKPCLVPVPAPSHEGNAKASG